MDFLSRLRKVVGFRSATPFFQTSHTPVRHFSQDTKDVYKTNFYLKRFTNLAMHALADVGTGK